MNTALWANRARHELARVGVCATQTKLLTPSEERVAELAASGMTNRDIAAAVFISPKTVEANLVRIYRKLNIHSRAELGRMIGQQSRLIGQARSHRWPRLRRQGVIFACCAMTPVASARACT